jgi:hypothetical protein
MTSDPDSIDADQAESDLTSKREKAKWISHLSSSRFQLVMLLV